METTVSRRPAPGGVAESTHEKQQVSARTRREGNPRVPLVGLRPGVAAAKTGGRVLRKSKTELPSDLGMALLGSSYPKKTKTLTRRDSCTLLFTAAEITLGRSPRAPRQEEWVKKTRDTYARDYYSVIRCNEILPFATTRVELESRMLSDRRQSEDTYRMIALACPI